MFTWAILSAVWLLACSPMRPYRCAAKMYISETCGTLGMFLGPELSCSVAELWHGLRGGAVGWRRCFPTRRCEAGCGRLP